MYLTSLFISHFIKSHLLQYHIHFGHQKLVFSSVENRFKKLIMNEDVINYNKFKLIQLKDRELYLNKVSGIVFESIEDSIFRIDKLYDDKCILGH